MCGITGIYAFNLVGKFNKVHVTNATIALEKRGPDVHDVYLDEWVGLGHRRLSIIDTSSLANQPMWDETNRYAIVFNGEIFNHRELRQTLESKGVAFKSHSDTEVILNLYIHQRDTFLSKLNGFFAFCIYDKVEQQFFLARDRYGIKPLLYVFDDDKFIFSSEMKSILEYGIEKELDIYSLHTYLQLNYTPAPHTMLTNVKKLLPGHALTITYKKLEQHRYYQIPTIDDKINTATPSYDEAKTTFARLLEDAVERRLIADVPLVSFLSGGIDSSVIAALAHKHKPDLKTFSIGFKDDPFFDETHYATLVANHFKTDHTVFSLKQDDLLEHLQQILQYTDEPFADSSAIPMYILCKQTRKHATVALSGDGADELLGGYNKHAAFYRSMHLGWKEQLVKLSSPLLKALPQARHSSFSNTIRQLVRFADGATLSPADRYWKWAGYATQSEVSNLLHPTLLEKFSTEVLSDRKNNWLTDLRDDATMNDVLRVDTTFVLPNDMLTKVDLMSMANSLEVRVPFLDYKLVNYIFSLPSEYKINSFMRKRILQDSFQHILPKELYNRPKKGFEVPLLHWFKKDLKSAICNDLLNQDYIKAQGIFAPDTVENLVKQVYSSSPQDSPARIWGIFCFQHWYKRYFSK
jgi:asparagine synthase (glutamine-hydrolysing)